MKNNIEMLKDEVSEEIHSLFQDINFVIIMLCLGLIISSSCLISNI
jgi:hypothetical protein